MMTRRTSGFLRLFPLLLVFGMAFVYRAEIFVALQGTFKLGWIAMLIFPLFLLWNYVAAIGWRTLVIATTMYPVPSSWRLSVVRLQGQAVNLVVPSAGIGGDVLRSLLIAKGPSGIAGNASSVVLDTTASTVAGIIFTIIGLGLHASLLPIGSVSLLLVVGLSLTLVALLCLLPSILSRLAMRHRFEQESPIGRFLETFLQTPARLRPAFRSAIVWHFLERMLTAGEIWLIARGLGLTFGIIEAIFATALMIGFSLLFFFIPSQVGAAEGGLALAFSILGLTPTSGLTAAFVRRGRQLVICSVGLTILLFRDGYLTTIVQHLAPQRFLSMTGDKRERRS